MLTTDIPHIEPMAEVISEIQEDRSYGNIIGCCKWFNKKLGYGFITVYNGEHKGVNIFVHHTCIQPLNSNFKTLKKGEYVSFNVTEGKNGIQATDVKGILGGPLLCDNVDTVTKPKFYQKVSQQPVTQEEL